ncbi:MAG: BREX system P-loop protein BrxC [Thermoanaerobaculia bacterium]
MSPIPIREIFASDVTRDIAPVVYFHQQNPEQVAEEVAEYIITGGYPQGDPRHQRNPAGIHEQLVRLLRGLAAGLADRSAADLPASWISGFYGSGKSIFAKLLGLALDGLELPDGRPLAEALLQRDDSPLAGELRDAWRAVRENIDPMAVVFDVGTVARDDEHIHAAAKRQIATRLGYCPTSHLVAEHELKLEVDGEWQAFTAKAEEVLAVPWSDANEDELAEEHFSAVMHALHPERYVEPMSWFDSHVGMSTGAGSSVEETTRDVARMLDLREPGKTLFLVVDEVSQYIHHNESRMLKLQSFVADLGQKLEGRVWLLATGQQKLEDSENESNLGKLKDRFPPRLRVHLAPTNIRDVVHKRLLKKEPAKEPALRELFQQHRADLKNYGYGCESITEEDFVEVYPMLPGHIDLLMQMTSVLRIRSTRVKGDDYAIRGLLQLLGEMFRQQKLGDQELGALVTLEGIFEIQQSALDVDTQNSLTRVFNDETVAGDEIALRVAKAVALLELIQEHTPTTSTLVSQCLYSRLGIGDREPEIRQALEKLQDRGHLSTSDKLGYRLQSSAGQDWQRERDARAVTRDELSQVVAEKLTELAGNLDPPRLRGTSFPWAAFYNDGAQRHDERLLSPRDPAVITLDFHYSTHPEKRAQDLWIQASSTAERRDRMVWVCGSPGDLDDTLRQLARSRHMARRYETRVSTLKREQQRLVYEEQGRRDELETKTRNAVAAVFLAGEIYYRGRPLDKQHHGTTFGTLVPRLGEVVLRDLYDRYVDIAVTPGELAQLLEPQLAGPSHKFMADGLGILDLDAGKYVFACSGQVPSRIAQHVSDHQGIAGGPLLTHFGGPPYGYPPDVVKAALAGLLRAQKIRIRPEVGPGSPRCAIPGSKTCSARIATSSAPTSCPLARWWSRHATG